MPDPNPLPWGTQDRFQAHFIVRKTTNKDPMAYTAKTILSTEGHFGAKKVIDVKWNGGQIATVLNEDSELNEKIAKQNPNDATIFVDQTNTGVRIYSKWKNEHDFVFTKDLFEIYDKIARHLKSI